ncbi:MAG: hypothetical protein R2745_00850 [Vicinamibacterales bacterium]
MPSLGASVAAMLAGWVLDDVLAPYVGFGTRLVVGLVATSILWVLVFQWLRRLRDG